MEKQNKNERKINGMFCNLEKMETEDLLAVRKWCGASITERIVDMNAINSELNRRQEPVLPEFGKPFSAHDVLSSEQLSFEHDTFGDFDETA